MVNTTDQWSISEWNDKDVNSIWFQHTANKTLEILYERFDGMISLAVVTWIGPRRSCDLFLWDFLKLYVYAIQEQSSSSNFINLYPEAEYLSLHQFESKTVYYTIILNNTL